MSDLMPGAAPEVRRSRSAQRVSPSARRRRRQRRIRTVVVVVLLGVLVVAAGLFVKNQWSGLFGGDDVVTASDFTGPGQGEVQVQIAKGASGAAIGQALTEAGVVASQRAFTTAISEYSAETGIAPNLSYGTYSLQLEMKAADALAAMLDKANLVQDGVTVREGLSVAETIARLSSVTTIPVEDFEAALEDPAAIGLPEQADGDAEGWLAPATYPYEEGTTAVNLLSTMVAKQISDMDGLGIAEGDRMEALIKASLVEKEAPAEARAKVARVIENRLDQGMPLQFDSTIHFIAGEGSADASTTDEQRKVDSPYNTYRYEGLPPGPIANPGKAALEAVAEPEPGNWVFFVTVNPETGETKFTDSYDEHLVNRQEYLTWINENSTADAGD
jgi:UPF0755 protein